VVTFVIVVVNSLSLKLISAEIWSPGTTGTLEISTEPAG